MGQHPNVDGVPERMHVKRFMEAPIFLQAMHVERFMEAPDYGDKQHTASYDSSLQGCDLYFLKYKKAKYLWQPGDELCWQAACVLFAPVTDVAVAPNQALLVVL